jgi:hypothetical protein
LGLILDLLELILTGVWYIWWEQSQHVHEETVQMAFHAAMAIGALATIIGE